MDDFYVKNMSFSQLTKFTNNTWDWQNQRVLWIYDTKMSVSWAVWSVAHKFVEVYLQTWKITEAVMHSNKCIYGWSDWKTYLIDIDQFKVGKKPTLKEVQDNWKSKWINFGKSWTHEKLLKDIEKARASFLSEKIDFGKVLSVEHSMEHEVQDVLWGSLKVISPLPFKCISDIIWKTTSEVSYEIMDDWKSWIKKYPKWTLYIEDLKFKWKFSDMRLDNPSYFFQALFNYYCVWVEFGQKPAFMIFRENKISANRDGSSQQQTIIYHFSWLDFELYKTFFWRYLLETFERIKLIQERDFLFNIFSAYWAEWEFEKQKAYYMDVKVWQLKQRISVAEHSKVANKIPMWNREWIIDEDTKIDKIEVEELNMDKIEDQIRVKFADYWIPLEYIKTIEWYAIKQALFSPERWVRMKDVESKLQEIQQATGIEEIRIEAPVPWTKFVWVEFPNENRRFLPLSEYTIKKKWLIIPIWKWIDWKTVEIDLSDSDNPHLIVAWKTWSWKSEFLKCTIESIIDKCDMVLIDPKMVEFMSFADRAKKYLTNNEEIFDYLTSLNSQMHTRYKLLRENKVTDIKSYNKKAKQKLKPIVVVFDEFEKITFWTYWDEIQWLVWQLTNLWRAAWIHLIIATQRPTVKVVNWQIKANISTRVCLSLWSSVDSKVVLDEAWAEKLLWKGDTLFKHNWKTVRLQSYYIPNE